MLEESRSDVQNAPAMPKPAANYITGFGPAMEQATLGSTVTVKGELSGSQALYIDGHVEGSIQFAGQRVTVGRTAVVLANIAAREIIVMGRVTGNIDGSERVDIRSEAVFTGEVVTQRISIDEGAMVKGHVRVRKTGREQEDDTPKVEAKQAEKDTGEPPSKPTVPAPAAKPLVSSQPAPQARAAAASTTGPQATSRVAGSKVLFEVEKSGK